MKYLRTSDLARAVGIYPNTVRLYVDWGLIPPVERSPSGYRLFTQRHLECLKLARTIYAAQYPGRELRASAMKSSNAPSRMIGWAHWKKRGDIWASVKAELKRADAAANLLEHWAQQKTQAADDEPLSMREAAKLLEVSHDVIRNWERNGLISVRRNSYNNYRLFGPRDIERLQVIRMLSHAGYSHMAVLRMFIELDGGKTRGLKKILDTPRDDEDIFTAADHWLTTLQAQEKLARYVIQLIKVQLASRKS